MCYTCVHKSRIGNDQKITEIGRRRRRKSELLLSKIIFLVKIGKTSDRKCENRKRKWEIFTPVVLCIYIVCADTTTSFENTP